MRTLLSTARDGANARKLAPLPLVAALAFAAVMSPTIAEAKSVKWSCVALDANTPWVYTCTASSGRP